MRKTILLLASVAVAMIVAGGVAWAATIQCPNARTPLSGSPICEGTAKADRMLGTSRYDEMYGKKGGDTMYGRGGEGDFMQGNPGPDRMFGGPGRDRIEGGPGVDKLYGNERPDTIWTGVTVSLGRDEGVENSDFSDDYAYGGRGNDFIVAGGARGVDRIYGDKENDRISVGPNSTKEIVDCGSGAEDWVRFDQGVDVIKNCEIKHPF